MRAAILAFGDENTLMLHFGTEEVINMQRMIDQGETTFLPAMSLEDMSNHFGYQITHVQFVMAATEEAFNDECAKMAEAFGMEEGVRETGDYNPNGIDK